MMKSLLIVVSGFSCTGKTTLAKKIAERYSLPLISRTESCLAQLSPRHKKIFLLFLTNFSCFYSKDLRVFEPLVVKRTDMGSGNDSLKAIANSIQ